METYGFDIEKANYIVDNFADSADLTCMLIDNAGNIMKSEGPEPGIYQALGFDMNLLKESFLYGAYQAAIYGGSYIFFCPYSLIYFTTPLMNDGIAGAIVAGPLMMTPPDEFLVDSIRKNSLMKDLNEQQILDCLDVIPLVSTKRVKALANLLFAGMHYIDPLAYEGFLADRKGMEVRSETTGYINRIQSMGGSVEDGALYPIEKERELMNLIAIGDQKGATKLLDQIMLRVFTTFGGDFQSLKSRVLELVVLLSRAALEGGAQVEEVFGLNYSYLDEIHRFRTADELTEWLANVCRRFTMSVFRFGEAKHKDAIFKAMDYIRGNYMNKLTLEEVASHVFFSPQHFSKIFGKETGTTFNRYLNKVRINNSKTLLKNKDINIADIANMVGFHDQSHFTKTFTALVGMNPKKFRESL